MYFKKQMKMNEKDKTFQYYFQDLISLLIEKVNSYKKEIYNDDFEKSIFETLVNIINIIKKIAKEYGIIIEYNTIKNLDFFEFNSAFEKNNANINIKNYKYVIIKIAEILIKKKNTLIGLKKNDFNMGTLHAYYIILEKIKIQALAFQIDLKEIGLENVELEEFVFA